MTKSKIKTQEILALAKELNENFKEHQEIFNALRTLLKTTNLLHNYDFVYVPAQIYHGKTEVTPCLYIYSDDSGHSCITHDFGAFYVYVINVINESSSFYAVISDN